MSEQCGNYPARPHVSLNVMLHCNLLSVLSKCPAVYILIDDACTLDQLEGIIKPLNMLIPAHHTKRGLVVTGPKLENLDIFPYPLPSAISFFKVS